MGAPRLSATGGVRKINWLSLIEQPSTLLGFNHTIGLPLTRLQLLLPRRVTSSINGRVLVTWPDIDHPGSHSVGGIL